VRPGEVLALLGSHFEEEENRAAGRPWFLAHADALLAKLPVLHALGERVRLCAALRAHQAKAGLGDALARARRRPSEPHGQLGPVAQEQGL
jgi:hypothetical protein